MIEILSHRGYWRDPAEKNARSAFLRSFGLGLGTETDIRDHGRRLLISHDPPDGDEPTLAEIVDLASPRQPTLALNVKADGLAKDVSDVMREANYPRWFVFDMSVPDMRAHLAEGNPVYTRMSEFEPMPVLLEQSRGVWLDAFETDDWRVDALRMLIDQGRQVCVVSPELHRRAYEPFWREIRRAGLHRAAGLMLCTDLPEAAIDYFEVAR